MLTERQLEDLAAHNAAALKLGLKQYEAWPKHRRSHKIFRWHVKSPKQGCKLRGQEKNKPYTYIEQNSR